MTLLPPPAAYGVLALCASSTAWLWLAARALFNDRFGWTWSSMALALGMVALGTAADFLHHHRLQEAASRLTSESLPILTIALECGYGSIGPFNRAFRQRFGMTPTEYRAAARMAQPRTAG
jgi:AraC-like DNA-binding protein